MFHIFFVTVVPFSLLIWLNTSIYFKLTSNLNVLRRTGENIMRRREMTIGKYKARWRNIDLYNWY